MPKVQEDDGGTTVHMSLNELNESLFQNVMEGNMVQVRDLLQKGANANARYYIDYETREILGGHALGDDGDRVLMAACVGGHVDVVRELLLKHKHVGVNAKNLCDRTALMDACENGHVQVVRFLLTLDNVDVNARDRAGRTALLRRALMTVLRLFASS